MMGLYCAHLHLKGTTQEAVISAYAQELPEHEAVVTPNVNGSPGASSANREEESRTTCLSVSRRAALIRDPRPSTFSHRFNQFAYCTGSTTSGCGMPSACAA